MPNRYYDNTRISEARNCMRKYYLRHRRDWTRDGLAKPLLFGLCWHEGMDAVWLHAASDKSDSEVHDLAMLSFNKKWVEEGGPSWETMTPDMQDLYSPRTPGIAAEMLHHYIKQRRGQLRNFEIIGIEIPFAVPLDPNDPELFFIGRFDKVFKDSYENIIVGEHKTTSLYSVKDKFQPRWVDSWSPASQIDGYLYAAHMLYGDNVKSVWIDGALVHKKVHDAFKFVPVNRQVSHLKSWLWETLFWVRMIEDEEERFKELKPDAEYLAAYPKNTGSCSDWSGCTFKDVCTMIPNPAIADLPVGFSEKHWEPFDVLEIEKLGMEKGNG